MTAWPERFLAAREALDPLLRAGRYRFAGMERWGFDDRSASAEYRGPDRRLRLVFDAEEELLWVDTAVERDAQIISRWTDIEWVLAGQRLDPNFDLSEDRIAALATAVARFLVANDLPPVSAALPPDQS